ncbi:MAG: SRPBCC family protein [Candidatus Pseudobacter hemicellulosilyticus]|uniref:SRPBCC family protein n=1 Tax=Candidatus Pseudobacter hemicellulosilyticus TaxID=3121375 RepID=A0AAJ6BHW0_9BACT|nr:MAG: SRPBCC family protein [Pseudobacter sp.]
MRLIKLALISFVVLFAIVYGISLMIPSQVRISRAIDIQAPADSILPRLRDLRYWEQWNGLVNNPDMSGQLYTIDSYSAEQLQVRLQAPVTDTVKTLWRQQNGKEIASGFTWHEAGGTTVVQWYFDVRLRWYPWEKFGSIIFDKQLGPPMEQSLDKLRKLLESAR